MVRPATLALAGWVLLLRTLEAQQWSAEEWFWLYRNRWQCELQIKQLQPFLLLVRLGSCHRATVQATIFAALVAWALQEQEGQALVQLLVHTPGSDQERLLPPAYLPFVEQWEAEETVQPQAEPELRRSVSL